MNRCDFMEPEPAVKIHTFGTCTPTGCLCGPAVPANVLALASWSNVPYWSLCWGGSSIPSLHSQATLHGGLSGSWTFYTGPCSYLCSFASACSCCRCCFRLHSEQSPCDRPAEEGLNLRRRDVSGCCLLENLSGAACRLAAEVSRVSLVCSLPRATGSLDRA